MIAVYRFAPVVVWNRILNIIKRFFIPYISVLSKNFIKAVADFLIMLFYVALNIVFILLTVVDAPSSLSPFAHLIFITFQ